MSFQTISNFNTNGNYGKVGKIKKFPALNDEQQLSDFLSKNFSESLKQMIKVTVRMMIKQEMETFRSEFSEKLYFNGSYPRNMTGTFGKIDNVPVPRFRNNPDDFVPKTLDVFSSEQEKFMNLVNQMHILGISQRKIKQLAKTCLGINISKNHVGKIHSELAQKEEFNINSQQLDDNFEYILLDGVYAKTKGYGWEDNDSVLLCALAIRHDGTRKIIGFTLARSEDYDNWHKLLLDIKKRGLLGKSLKLAIIDDTQAAKNALAQIYPNLKIQTCVTHKMRNVITETNFKSRPALIPDLKQVFNSKSKDEAIKQAKVFCKKWYIKEEKAVRSFRHNLEDCFTYMEFPQHLWTKIRTTNILEREFREVRRRIKVFDNTFNSVQSITNYANSIFTNLNKNYPAYQNTFTQ